MRRDPVVRVLWLALVGAFFYAAETPPSHHQSVVLTVWTAVLFALAGVWLLRRLSGRLERGGRPAAVLHRVRVGALPGLWSIAVILAAVGARHVATDLMVIAGFCTLAVFGWRHPRAVLAAALIATVSNVLSMRRTRL